VVQQGYATSEPYLIEKEGKIKPKVFLLADDGYPAYASFALVPDALIAKNPAAVKAFVEATAAGWTSYLYGDAKPGDAADPQGQSGNDPGRPGPGPREDALYGIVPRQGVGKMDDARWAEFFKVASEQGVYPKDMDYKSAYTLQFLPKVAMTPSIAALSAVEVDYAKRARRAYAGSEVDYARGRALGPGSDLAPARSSPWSGRRAAASPRPAAAGRAGAPTRGTVTRAAGKGETSVVFQAPTLAPWLSAAANVALPLEAGRRTPPRPMRAPGRVEALAKVGLGDAENARPAQLSGGMAMRASLARALVTRPRLLLLDEPFAALDEITRRALADDVLALAAELAPAMVFVTHNVEEAVYMAGRVVVMSAGPGRIAGEVASRGRSCARPASAPRRLPPRRPRRCPRLLAQAGDPPPMGEARRVQTRLSAFLSPLILIGLLLIAWEIACRAWRSRLSAARASRRSGGPWSRAGRCCWPAPGAPCRPPCSAWSWPASWPAAWPCWSA
jgi:NitT/TauT family transport system ATP-binding protein